MELNETVEGMLSGDYRERFIAEYRQLEIRIDELTYFIVKVEDAIRNHKPVPRLDCPIELLRKQLGHMLNYKMALKERSLHEGIEI